MGTQLVVNSLAVCLFFLFSKAPSKLPDSSFQGVCQNFRCQHKICTRLRMGESRFDKDSRYVLIVQNWKSADAAADFLIKQQAKPELKAQINNMMEPGTFRRRELTPYGQ